MIVDLLILIYRCIVRYLKTIDDISHADAYLRYKKKHNIFLNKVVLRKLLIFILFYLFYFLFDTDAVS